MPPRTRAGSDACAVNSSGEQRHTAARTACSVCRRNRFDRWVVYHVHAHRSPTTVETVRSV